MTVLGNVVSSTFTGISASSDIISGILPTTRGGTGDASAGNVVLSTAPTLSNVFIGSNITIGTSAISETLGFRNIANVSSSGLNVAGTLNSTSYNGNGYGLSSLNIANLSGSLAVINGGTGTSTSTGTAGNLVLSEGPTVSNMVAKNAVYLGTLASNTAVVDGGNVLGFRANGVDIANVTATGLNVAGTIFSGNGVSISNATTTILQSTGVLIGIGKTAGAGYQLDLSLDTARKLTTTTWTTGSDRRIKEEIEDANLDMCVELVESIPLKRFAWKASYAPSQTDRHQLGWIAQDVEDAGLEKAVTISEDHGYPDFRSLNTDQLYKVMWGALQKHMGDLRDIEARLQ